MWVTQSLSGRPACTSTTQQQSLTIPQAMQQCQMCAAQGCNACCAVLFDQVDCGLTAAVSCCPCVLSCTAPVPQTYAFLEMRSVEEASNAMAFDGVVFKDTNLKVGRPGRQRGAGSGGAVTTC